MDKTLELNEQKYMLLQEEKLHTKFKYSVPRTTHIFAKWDGGGEMVLRAGP